MVWFPGATYETAQHHLKLAAHGLSLVRMKHRFGVRWLPPMKPTRTYPELRPSGEFVKVDVAMVYRIHPVPSWTHTIYSDRTELYGASGALQWQLPSRSA